MVIRSPFPDIDIPNVNLLTYLFGSGEHLSDKPVWINASNTEISLSPRSALQWIKRLGIGLDKLGVNQGEVVLHISPNHIFTAVAYLGTVGAGRVFSGANPLYTADGMSYFSRLSRRLQAKLEKRLPSIRVRIWEEWNVL